MMQSLYHHFETSLKEVTFPLAVAVSGGADSLALLYLAHELAQKNNEKVVALTVDHGLRENSRKEALQVQEWSQSLGIQHVILEWFGAKPKARIQEKAREARYDLLTQWCQEHGIRHLLLGHHRGDQEETFWMRLSSGSGLDGLRGMKPLSLKDNVMIHRPLLGCSKEDLKSYLLKNNHQWIEDPSNQSARFLRGRLRDTLKDEGLSSERLSTIMTKLGEDSDFIQKNVYTFLTTFVQIHRGGYVTVEREALMNLHPSLYKRSLAHLMGWFKGPSYPPRASQLELIYSKIKVGKSFTAGGIYWSVKTDKIYLFREYSVVEAGISLKDIHKPTLWDGRFIIHPGLKENVSRETILGPLGMFHNKPSRRFLTQVLENKQINLNDKDLESIPPPAIPCLPTLFDHGKIVAIFPLWVHNDTREKEFQKKLILKPLFHDSLRITM